MAERSLTDKQKAFINAYVLCLNATEAAISAGYSPDSARLIGHENITKPYIRAEIDRRLAELSPTVENIIGRLREQAEASAADFLTVDDEGTYQLDLAKASERGKLHLIKSIKQTKYGLAIELYDAQAALVHLGRHHGLFTDNVRVKDWRDEFVELIKAGKVEYPTLSDELGADLATELFTMAGVNVSPG